MARELGRVNVNDLTENSYKVLGIVINRSSNSNGIFATNYTTLNQAKDNLKNLILTRKGERLYMPDFGTNLLKFIFEPNDITTQSEIDDILLFLTFKFF